MALKDLPSAQKIGAVVIYGAVLGTISRLFGAWEVFRSLLLRGGRYSHLCSPEQSSVSRVEFVQCDAQFQAVNELFGTYMMTEGIGSIIAGVLFDRLGPRLCGLIGSILCVLQFELQIHDSPLFDGMTVAAIIGGLSVNLVAYPAMVLECMFPDNAALAVTYSEYIDALYFIPLAVCLQGLCSLVPPLLMKIWRGLPDLTFESYWRSLMMFAAIPLCVVYVLALPKSRDEEEPKEKTEKRPLVKQVEELLEAMATPEYVCVVVLTGILMLMGVWYQSDMASLVGPTIARDMGWWMWTDAFLGLAQGKLCDSVGTPIMILLQLVCYGLIFLASLSGEHAGQYGTVFLWIATMSYTYGIKYTFAQEFLAPHLRGTLIGVAGVTSGLFLSLLRVISRTGSPEYWCIIFTMVCGSLTPAAMYLWYRKVQLKQKID